MISYIFDISHVGSRIQTPRSIFLIPEGAQRDSRQEIEAYGRASFSFFCHPSLQGVLPTAPVLWDAPKNMHPWKVALIYPGCMIWTARSLVQN